MEKPGFWRLFGAYSIDFVLLGLVGSLLGYLVAWVLVFYIIMLHSGGDWAVIGGVITFIAVFSHL